MNDHEQRTTLLLDAATTGLAPDVDHLVAGGVARGRVLRRRRRAGTALAAAAVIGVVGTAAGVTPALRGGTERAVDPPVASPRPSAPATEAAERRFGTDRHKTAAVLVSLLPAGDSEPLDAWGSDDPGDQYRDGLALHQGAQVSVHLEHPDRRGQDSSPEEQCRDLAEAVCRDLPGGEWYAVEQTGQPGEGGIRSTTVTLFTTDGFALAATAWNAPAPRGVEPVRDEPVLDRRELLDVVGAPVWIDEQQ